ncbi:hypothetical protein E1264_18450 [Actinomadura sp. KC216]|uniref:hypothetical protein n=1 Tax=Actinomadura sp. KC216 TaxID=2530370 RepID=UPI0010491C85|nr:hypothetical protein [Actinomadura sp. KC216]TDB86276.1 hypothetical protein E1264_18450 [Actinomadura sp. KC216]
MSYATVVELTAHLGYAPEGAQRLLDRASRDVDRALLCSVYDATDTAVTDALKAATLEQVAYQLTIGNVDGIAHGMQPGVPTGSSAGAVDLSRGTSVGGASAGLPWLADQAFVELQRAGLTGQGPLTYLGG